MFLRSGGVSGEPGLLDQRQARRNDMLQFVRRHAIREGLLKQRRSIRLPHPHSGAGVDKQRRQAHDERKTRPLHHTARDRVGVMDAPLLQPQQGKAAIEIIGPGIEVVLDIEGKAFLQHPLGKIETAKLHRVFGRVGVGARDMFMQAVLEREAQAFIEITFAFRPPTEHHGGADIVESVGAHFGVREFFLQRQRAPPPFHGLVHLVVQHVKLGPQ